jgi:non-specific serine/threonine protein kinase
LAIGSRQAVPGALQKGKHRMGAFEAPVPLRIKLFGSMEVEVRGEPLPKLRSRRELWLLALLALQHGRPVTRGWVAQTLWPFPDHAADQAAYNLRRALSNLRKALGAESARLQTVPPSSVRLDLTGASVDAAAFAEAVAAGDGPMLETAVYLYGGPLLLECTEPWAIAARASFEQHYLACLRALGDRALSAEDFESAAGYLRRAVAVDPLSEPVHRSLMQVLHQCGDIVAALTVYQDLTRSLHRERNVYPAPETTALYYRLRAELRARPKAINSETPSSGPSASLRLHSLPVPLTALIGRTEDVREIASRFQQSRLMTLTGAGGVGKTRLAIQVAEEIASEFRDGVCFIDLAAITDPSQVAPMLASALEQPEAPDAEVIRTITTFLRSRQVLLVLDNCEHLIEPCASLAQTVLQSGRDVSVLATSRQSLGIAGEEIWRVASLSLPDPDRLPIGGEDALTRLQGCSAVELFVARAAQANPAFRLTSANGVSVARICLHLEGIPLALELAAARVRALTVEQIEDRLGDRFQLLTQGPRTARSRQQTLEAAIKWSFDLLEERDGDLLRALSVFAGGWTLEDAERVGAEIDIDRGETADILSRLVDRSLVNYGVEGGQARYRFLETVRQYCCEKWMGSEALQRASKRHLSMMLQLAADAAPHLQGLDQAKWFERIQCDHANMLSAIDWSLTQTECAEEGLKLVSGLWRFWHRRGYLSLGRRCFARLLDRTRTDPATTVRAEALIGEGMLALFQGDLAGARQSVNESLAIGCALGADNVQANAEYGLGRIAWDQGELPEARGHFLEVLKAHRLRGELPQIAITLNYLGVIASDAGDHEAARGFFGESLEIGRALGDNRLVANALNGLAHMASNLCDHAAAREYYSEELNLAQALHDKELSARTLHRLASVEQAVGDMTTARRLFEECLFAAENLAYHDLESAALQSLGLTACAQSDYSTARSCFEHRLQLCEERGDKRGATYTLDAFGGLLVAQKQMHEAVPLFAAAQTLRAALGGPSPVNQSIGLQLQEAKSALGDEDFAQLWETGNRLSLEEAVKIARKQYDVIDTDDV